MKPAYQFERLGMESNLPGILCRYSPGNSAGIAVQAHDAQSVGGEFSITTISRHLALIGPVAKPGQSAFQLFMLEWRQKLASIQEKTS